MGVAKKYSASRRVTSHGEVPKSVRVRQDSEAEKVKFDAAFHASLAMTLDEWLSPEDEEAFRDL